MKTTTTQLRVHWGLGIWEDVPQEKVESIINSFTEKEQESLRRGEKVSTEYGNLDYIIK